MSVAAVAVLDRERDGGEEFLVAQRLAEARGCRQEEEAEQRPHDEQHEERAEAGQRQAGPGERCAVR